MTYDANYPDLLQHLWIVGKPFVIVEHDVITPNLTEIVECPEPWCAYGYKDEDLSRDDSCVYLGCTKISAELIKDTSGVWESMPNRIWQLCDCHLTGVARAKGFNIHQHYPSVKHIKEDSRNVHTTQV